MKKFTLLMCALMILVGANAAPEQTKRVMSHVKKVQRHSTKEGKSQAGVKAYAGEQTEAFNVEVIALFDYYDDEEGLYIYELVGDDDWSYDFAFATDGEDIELNHQYKFGVDMDDYWSYMYDSYDPENYADYADATFIKTINEEGYVIIDATITDESGDMYVLHFDESTLPVIPQGGEYEADTYGYEYYAEDGDYYNELYVEEIDAYFMFDIYLAEGVTELENGKTYTFAEMDDYYSYIDFGGKGIYFYDLVSADFTRTISEDGTATVVANAVDTDGNTWKVTWTGEVDTETGLNSAYSESNVVTKKLVNGVLTIEKNGVIYNAQGTTLK